MLSVLLALLAQTMLLWPGSTALAAIALRRPPREVRLGMGPAWLEREVGGTTVSVGALPIGAFVAWGDDPPPPGLDVATHGGWALVYGLAAGFVDPEALAAALRFATAVATFQPTGVGGVAGAWLASAPHASEAPLGAVLAALTAVSVFNVGYAVLSWAARASGTAFRYVATLVPFGWLLWLVWLDVRAFG